MRLGVQLKVTKLHTQTTVVQDVLQPVNMTHYFGEVVVLQQIDIYIYISGTPKLRKDQDEERKGVAFQISCLWF